MTNKLLPALLISSSMLLTACGEGSSSSSNTSSDTDNTSLLPDTVQSASNSRSCRRPHYIRL